MLPVRLLYFNFNFFRIFASNPKIWIFFTYLIRLCLFRGFLSICHHIFNKHHLFVFSFSIMDSPLLFVILNIKIKIFLNNTPDCKLFSLVL